MNYETALQVVPYVYGFAALVCLAVGYWFGEQSAYRSLGYGSENPFASARYWFSSWFPKTYRRVNELLAKRPR